MQSDLTVKDTDLRYLSLSVKHTTFQEGTELNSASVSISVADMRTLTIAAKNSTMLLTCSVTVTDSEELVQTFSVIKNFTIISEFIQSVPYYKLAVEVKRLTKATLHPANNITYYPARYGSREDTVFYL